MNRLRLVVMWIGASFVLAACGNSASAGNTTSPSPGAGGAPRGGASGQLVQINGDTLILTGANGDVTVTYTNTTTFTKTSTATLADIRPGQCIFATGAKDPSGLITATSVRLAPKNARGCTTGGAAFSPPAGASPRPTPSGQAGLSLVSGEVTAVIGTSVTVVTPSSGSQTVTVPTVANVTMSSAASAASLQVGQCLRATGPPDASGSVQATSIAITPPGANGTCTSGSGFGRRPGSGAPPAGG